MAKRGGPLHSLCEVRSQGDHAPFRKSENRALRKRRFPPSLLVHFQAPPSPVAAPWVSGFLRWGQESSWEQTCGPGKAEALAPVEVGNGSDKSR